MRKKNVYDSMRDDRRKSDLSNAELIAAIKQAQRDGAKEWMDEKFAQFGKWTVGTVLASAFFALTVFLIKAGYLKL